MSDVDRPGQEDASSVGPPELDVVLPEQMFPEPVSGPSYGPAARLGTLSTVIFLVGYAMSVWSRRDDVAAAVWLLLAAAAAVLLVTAWYILTGRTTLDREGIRQDWVVRRQFRWHEISRARVMRMPFSTRLLLATGGGPMKAVHAGDAILRQAFARVSAFYDPRRGQRRL